MKITDDKLDILQNLESSVVGIWRAHPEMSDYTALRAYEAAFQTYRAELRGHAPKPSGLSGLDAAAFEAVKAMCEFRLAREPCPVPAPKTCLPFRFNCWWIVCGNSANLSNGTPRWTGGKGI